MRVIYLDEIFLINFFADYLLLLATAKIAGVTVKRKYMLLAAIIGGAYSVTAQFSEFTFVTSAVYKIASAVIMAIIVFGRRKSFFRILLIFLAVSAAFAGAVMGVSLFGGSIYGKLSGPVTFEVFALSFAVCWFVFSFAFNRAAHLRTVGCIYRMDVFSGDKKTSFSALGDTGNTLTDPMTGEGITICQVCDVEELFDKEHRKTLKRLPELGEARVFELLKDEGEKLHLFLVPYKTVGKKNGMLIAFRPSEIYKNGKKMSGGLIGIVPDGITEGRGYSAITSAE